MPALVRVSSVPAWVEPPAPKVTEKNLGRPRAQGRPLRADAHDEFGMARGQSALQLFVANCGTPIWKRTRFPALAALPRPILSVLIGGANKAYLESSYYSSAKLLERVPYTTREGMRIQLEEALKQSPESKITVDNLIDDSIVREIEKEGFIDKVYGKSN